MKLVGREQHWESAKPQRILEKVISGIFACLPRPDEGSAPSTLMNLSATWLCVPRSVADHTSPKAPAPRTLSSTYASPTFKFSFCLSVLAKQFPIVIASSFLFLLQDGGCWDHDKNGPKEERVINLIDAIVARKYCISRGEAARPRTCTLIFTGGARNSSLWKQHEVGGRESRGRVSYLLRRMVMKVDTMRRSSSTRTATHQEHFAR